MNILLVEDDITLAMGIEYSLKNEGFNVYTVGKIKDAKEKISNSHIDIILLDVNLPDGNGYELCKEVRVDSEVPIIFLTACDEEVNIVMGLDLGADDYLTKPFYLEELKMRIQALLKRSGKFSDNNLSYGELTVTTSTNTTTINGKEVEMLGKEFDLLVYFLQNQNVILPKSQIFDRIWGFDSDTTISVVEVYVSKIRKKLKGTTFAKNLQTLRSVGYILKNAE